MRIAPVLLVLGFGAKYLVACTKVLLGPNAPMQFVYLSRAGATRLTVNSYSYEPSNGTLRATGIALYDATDTPIARLASLELSGVKLFGGSPSGVRVVASGLQGDVVRNSDGGFQLLDYLPQQKSSSTPTAFSLDLTSADVRFVDLAGGSSWVQPVNFGHLRLLGLGGDFVANGDWSAAGIGAGRTQVRHSSNGDLTIDLDTSGLDLGRAFERLRSEPQLRKIAALKDLSAASLRASGPVTLYIPAKQPAEFTGKLDVTATGIRYADWVSASTAHFVGSVSEAGAVGRIEATGYGASANLQGAVSWNGGFRLDGMIDAKAGNLGQIPPRLAKLIPKLLKFESAAATGQLRVNGPKSVWFSGQASAAAVSWGKERASSVSGTVTASQAGVSADLRTAEYRGSTVSGRLTIDTSSKAISGWAKTPRAPLAPLAKEAGMPGFQGQTSLDAVLGGTLDSPTASVRGLGSATYHAKNGKTYDLGAMTMAMRLESHKLQVQRLTLIGLTGAVTAAGMADIDRKTLHLTVAGRGLEIAEVLPDWTGTAVVDGVVDGTFSDPKFTGHAEGFGVGNQTATAPVSTTDFVVDKRHVAATDLRMAKGSSFASGAIALRFADNALTGQFSATGLQLQDLVGEDVFGFADVGNATVSGTVDNPKLQASVSSDTVVAHGVKIDKIAGNVHLAGKRATIDTFVVDAAGGSLNVSGDYDLDSRSGKFSFVGTPMQISDLFAETATDAQLSGKLSATGAFSIDGKNRVSGKSKVVLDDVHLNGSDVGKGYADIDASGSKVTGSAQIGFLDRYVQVPSFAYDIDDKTIDGELVIYNYLLGDLYTSSERYLPKMDPQLAQKLGSIGGAINADVTVSGPRSKPDFDLKVVDATNLTMNGVDFGELHAAAKRTGPKWDFSAVKYIDGDATIQASGTMVEDGDVDFKGVVNALDLSKLYAVAPSLSGLAGRANSAFEVSGKANSPSVRGSLDSQNLSYVPAGRPENTLTAAVNIDTITASESQPDGTGGIAFQGSFVYRGLVANLSGSAPLKYPLEVPRDRPVLATIELPTRRISTLVEPSKDNNPNAVPIPLFPGVDLAHSDGDIQGKIVVDGTLNSLRVNGKVAATAKTLKLESDPNVWKDVSASATLGDRSLKFDAAATGSKGGSATATATASIQSLGDLFDAVRQNGIASLLDDPVTGSIDVKALRIDQQIEGNGRVAGKADAKIAIGGSLRAPSFNGDITIGQGDFTVPSTPIAVTTGTQTGFNPRFALAIKLPDPLRLRTSTSDFTLNGSGSVGGRLSRPEVSANFSVATGSIRLPTAKVRVDPGGTIIVSYQVSPTGAGQARANLNLVGRTSLTAPEIESNYVGLVQRYEITLNITGDLLQDGGLNLNASSDPPGLAQDRILGLLGQSDLFSVLGSDLNKDEAARRVRDALSGYALPVLLDPVTSKLAAGLGLDYLTVEYNSYEQATVDFAKSLGKGFVFEGRRQLSQPVPGIKALYDYRLTYHLRTRNQFLNRVAFGIGADQDHPWKISVEYSTRF